MRQARIGEVLDARYRVTGHLGVGGTGVVYRAEHVGIRRPVAIKILRPEFAAEPNLLARFEREAFATGQVQHPNCVAVSDFGQMPDGRLYLVMELLDGRILQDELSALFRFEPGRALHIARHVLSALDFAHQAGVVHRDVKPDNIILVKQDGDPDFAKLLDFSIAKLVGENASHPFNELTEAGSAVGTPAYIAPEQALGQDADPRADLYAVTAVLFEMLTGQPPFLGHDPIEVLRQHIHATPPTLSTRLPNVATPALDALIARGLAKKPDERFSSAGEFIQAINVLLMGAPPPMAVGPEASQVDAPTVVEPVPAAALPPVPFAAPANQAMNRQPPPPSSALPLATHAPVGPATIPPAATPPPAASIPNAPIQSTAPPSVMSNVVSFADAAPPTVANNPFQRLTKQQLYYLGGGALLLIIVGAVLGGDAPAPEKPEEAPVAIPADTLEVEDPTADTGAIPADVAPVQPPAPPTGDTPAVRPKLIIEDPESPSEVRSAAERLIVAEEYDMALGLLRKHEKMLEGDPTALLLVGHAACGAFYIEKCMSAYGEAMDLEPSLASDPALRRHLLRAARRNDAEIALPALSMASNRLYMAEAREIVVAHASRAENTELRHAARSIARKLEYMEDVDLPNSYGLDLDNTKSCKRIKAIAKKMAALKTDRIVPHLRRTLAQRDGEDEKLLKKRIGCAKKTINGILRKFE